MMLKALNRSVMLYAIMLVIDLTESFPSNYYESNSVTSSSEESLLVPSFSVKIVQSSSESSYESTTPLCKAKNRKINPNELVRERGYDIAGSPQFSQVIEVEECENVGSPCSYLTTIKSACRQRFMSIKLRVVSKDKKISIEDFTIPSVCECAFFSKNSHDLHF